MIRRLLIALALIIAATPPALAAPGRLLSATPVTYPGTPAQGWRIVYESRDARGDPVDVAAVVLTPRGRAPQGGWPVVAWAHGTWGLEPKCTASQQAAFMTNATWLASTLRRGFAVVATDYAGYSTGGMHAYLAGDAAGWNVIDAVRAARRVQGADTSRRFAVWGESQGAHAAIWTGQLARGYAPGLDLVGVAAAAPPTDLAANLGGGANATIRAFLTAYTGVSWEQVYGADLGTVARPVGRDLMRRIARNCVSLDGFRFSTQIGILRLQNALKGVDLPRIEPWRTLLARNSVSRGTLGLPLFVMQSDKDVVVAPAVTRAWVRDQCRSGQRLRFLRLANTEHQHSARDSVGPTLDWIGDRFAGRPEPDDCRSVR